MQITNKNVQEGVEIQHLRPGQCFSSGASVYMRLDILRGEKFGYVDLATGEVFYSEATGKIIPVRVEGIVDHASA